MADCEGLRSRSQGEKKLMRTSWPWPREHPWLATVARCRAPKLLTLLISRLGRESSGAIEASRSRLLRSRFVMESRKVDVSSEQNVAATLQDYPMSPCLGCCGFLLLELRRPPSMQHRFIRGHTEMQTGLSVEPSRARNPSLAGKKTPPGSCSVALSDRSQCDSTGPAAVWADDQAVTRAFAGPEVATADLCKRMVPANDDELQDPAASGKTCPRECGGWDASFSCRGTP